MDGTLGNDNATKRKNNCAARAQCILSCINFCGTLHNDDEESPNLRF